MKRSRSSPQVTKRWYRPLEQTCAECGRTLHEGKTLSKRTVVTLAEIINVTHARRLSLPGCAVPGIPAGGTAARKRMHWRCRTSPLGWTSCCWWGGCIRTSIRPWMI